ncbi:Lrp/AsnC family transcriptional regulator [Nitrospirillum sp. BR 11752]|uniref:Lrp/AsnC family transcriptional regulator n=1 Tax=Nitrospirillum amazonense TaxID=28077 RepID=A0A560H1W5_9PROT|nr:Lrp/AsnC family transcriptional regulator [Nitrospirillum amazonense]MEE3624321.1 Lrp/AsnC family transcriptional regulator [Nitrospirillum sp. BR 11752]TWB39620.1 Lrp/AsnC family transcriptional regulator [Nitrospirillum amazonense]
MATAELDAIDMKILTHMQRDASLTTAELAERVGISQSPCWRRVQRLHDEGYITAQVMLVDRQKLGFDMTIFAQVKIARLSEAERETFFRGIQNIPEVLECYTVFGEMDALLKIVAPDVRWYQEFIFNTLMKLPGVEDIRSIVTLSEAKNTTAIPLTPRTFQ